MKWNACLTCTILLTTLTLSACSGLGVQARSLPSTRPALTRQADDQFPTDPAEKFCNPDFAFGEGDTPDVTSKCANLDAFVCENRDPWHKELSQRCRKEI